MNVTKTVAKPATKGSTIGVWAYRILVLVGAGLILYSWFQPWWKIDLEEIGTNIVEIHPWGLAVDERMGSFDVLIQGAQMPGWFAPFMWAYLGLCMIALLAGIVIRGKFFNIGSLRIKAAPFLVGGVGLSYFIVGVVAAVYASIRLKSFYSTPLQGRIYVELGDAAHTYAESSLLPGWYWIFAAGALLMLVAFFHDLITNEFEDEE